MTDSAFKPSDQELDAAWGSGPKVLPDGKHQAQIIACRVEEAPWGEMQWSLEFQTEHGKVWKHHSLENVERIAYAGADAKALGYMGARSGLEEWCQSEAAIGLTCEITVKSKPKKNGGGMFTNVYIDRVGEKKPLAAPGGQMGPDDDLPF